MNPLDSLTETQRDQLYDMLLDLPTKEVVEKIAQPAPEGFGIKTHITTLRRFKDKYWAELAADREESAKRLATSTTTTSESIEKLETGIQISIRHHMFERVSAADITDAQLSMVSRWAHRQEKLKLDIQRVQIARERCAQNQLRLQLLARRSSFQNGRGAFHPCPTSIPDPATASPSPLGGERVGVRGDSTVTQINSPASASASHFDPRTSHLDYPSFPSVQTDSTQHSKLETGNSKLQDPSSAPFAFCAVNSTLRSLPRGHYINEQGRECDELGPLARNWEEIGERARKAFGITPEESARRAELRRRWNEQNAQQNSFAATAEDAFNSKLKAKKSKLADSSAPTISFSELAAHLTAADQSQPPIPCSADFSLSRSSKPEAHHSTAAKPLNIIELLKDITAERKSPHPTPENPLHPVSEICVPTVQSSSALPAVNRPTSPFAAPTSNLDQHINSRPATSRANIPPRNESS